MASERCPPHKSATPLPTGAAEGSTRGAEGPLSLQKASTTYGEYSVTRCSFGAGQALAECPIHTHALCCPQELAQRKDEVDRLKGEVATWRDKAASGGRGAGSGEERHEPLRPSRERDDLDPRLANILRKVHSR